MERVAYSSYWFIHVWNLEVLKIIQIEVEKKLCLVKLMKPINSELCILEEGNERSLQILEGQGILI